MIAGALRKPAVWLLRHVAPATLLLLASQLILLQAMLLVSKRLGNIGYGMYGLAMSANAIAAQFMQWGMDALLTVRFATGVPDTNRTLYGIVLRQRQLCGVAVLCVSGVLALLLPRADAPLVFLGAVDGVIVGLTLPSLFDAQRRNALWQFFLFLRNAFYLASIFALFTLWPQYVSPLAVVLVHAGCIFLQLILEQLWLQKSYGLPHWPAPVSGAVELMTGALPMALALLASQLLKSLGVPLLFALGRARETGVLYLSNQCSVVATSLIVVASGVLHARLAARSLEREWLVRQVRRATVACVAAGVLCSWAGMFAADWVPRVFGAGYEGSVAILKFDVWRLAAILAAAPSLSLLICVGRLRVFALIHALGLLAGVLIALWRVPLDGARGVALGIAIGHGVVFLLAVWNAVSFSLWERGRTVSRQDTLS